MKPELKIVLRHSKEPIPYDEARGIRRMKFLRNQLMAAAVRYVKDGKSGCRQDRVRESSDLTGIPRTLIEAEIRR